MAGTDEQLHARRQRPRAPIARTTGPERGAEPPPAAEAPVVATPPFVLSAGEPLSEGITRVAGEQLDAAVRRLENPAGVGAKDVHEARKSLKRLRALARLLRPVLADEDYRRENEALRDAARHLAGARDAEVIALTLDRLARDEGDDAFAALRTHLQGEREAAAARLQADAGPAREAAAELGVVRGRAVAWVDATADFAAIEPGLRRLYREGRERHRRVRRRATVERLHEWRKRVKDLRYCAELLAPLDPERMADLAEQADRLGEILGDEHDVGVLVAFAKAHPELFTSPAERTRLRKLARRESARLRRRAIRLGDELYARRPRRFTRPLVRATAADAPEPR